MAVKVVCDVHKGEVEKIVAKVYITDTSAQGKSGFHARYSHHADVCEECLPKLIKSFNFRQRKPRKPKT